MNYKIFKRTWYKFNPKWPNGLEPHASEMTILDYVDTREEAIAYCKLWNDAGHHVAGDPENRLCLKAEFEEI